MSCETPVWIDGYDRPFGRCGRCHWCRGMKRLEWVNRMMLEAYQKPYRPLFVTPTYRTQDLPKNYSESLRKVQLWLKRLRKRVGPIRYFAVTERGTKNGRLHQHLLIWNETLCTKKRLVDMWRPMWETWKYGALQSDPIRSVGGFYYVGKYITKNIWQDQGTGEIDQNAKLNKHGEWKNPGRLYTWSNKPAFGQPGIDRWTSLAEKWIQTNSEPPVNWFNMHLLGGLHKVYVPKDTYVRFCKENGIELHKEIDLNQEFDPLRPEVKNNKIWLDQKVLERIDTELKTFQ